MIYLNFKKNLLPLYVSLLLVGCKDAEIKGEWINTKDSFNKNYVISLITSVDGNLTPRDIEISELEDSNNSRFFYVTLVNKDYSREQLESLVSNIERLKNSHKTSLTVNFTNIADAADANEKDLLSVLQKAGMEKNGSQSTNIDWAKASITVYTREMRIMGQTDPYSDINKTVYCQLDAPLTDRLDDLLIEPFPYITSSDVPEHVASTMSPKQLDEYIKDENGLRRYVNIGMEIRGGFYPHKTILGGDFVTKFKESNSMITQVLPMSYYMDAQTIHFNFGEIPGNEPTFGRNDFGGVIHDKCADLIKKTTPELDKKWASAVQSAQLGKIEINPEWKPKDNQK